MSRAPERQWLRPLIVAVATIGGLVTSLVVLGRGAGSSRTDVPAGGSSAASSDGAERGPRHALPATAWAVLDVELQRLGEGGDALPEAFDGLDCHEVAPPARVALALLSPGARAGANHDRFEFLVAATETRVAFRECARRRMLQSGARGRTWPGGFDVLSREGGLRLVIHDAHGLIVFASAPSVETSSLLDVWEGAIPNAAAQGAHAELLRELGAHAGFALTVALPRTWLEGVIAPEEAAHSPLRSLKAAALSLRDQELYAIVDCHSAPATGDPEPPVEQLAQQGAQQTQPAGCGRLTGFLRELRDGLLLDGAQPGDSTGGGWTADPHQPSRFRSRWPLPRETRARLLSDLFATRP